VSNRSATGERVLLALQHVIAQSVLTNDRIARSAGLHIVDSQVLSLIALADHPLSAGEIRDRSGLPSSTTTRVIDRLEAQGYVRRTPDTADRRRVLVEAVPRRLAELMERYGDVRSQMATVMAGFRVADLATVARFLEAIATLEPDAS